MHEIWYYLVGVMSWTLSNRGPQTEGDIKNISTNALLGKMAKRFNDSGLALVL